MSLNLRAEGLSKLYAGDVVLKDFSHNFGLGITVLTGPNGSGKSTLLKLCALLDTPSEGRVIYSDDTGNELVHNMALKRRIAMVLPEPGIFNVSVLGNVLFGLGVRGIPMSDAKDKALGALEAVGLFNKQDQSALTLSSGESKRLAISRAMVINPDVVLLDEPTGSVDARNQEIIEDLITGKLSEGQRTIIVTTHDESQAARLSHHRLHLERGVFDSDKLSRV